VLLIWAERLPRGAGYRVGVEPLVEPLPSRDGLSEEAWSIAAATVINRCMEALIAHKPEQYLWGYDRYKQPRQMDTAA
jgi:Kdo2-lipid IVA lauroyltransferase/acyltransferase